MDTWTLSGILLGSYLLGALPFGYWIAKYFYGVDIRQHGSGNIGATNVLRVLGMKAAMIVFALDILKGWLPSFWVLRATQTEGWAILAGALAIAGHSLSPFLRFKGGKGIATGLGVVLGVAPGTALVGGSVWIITFTLTRRVSLASILAAITVPLSAYFLGYQPVTAGVLAAVASLVIWRHKDNIRRLLAGTEPRAGRKASPAKLAHACVELARYAVEKYVREGTLIEPDISCLPEELKESGGVFVAIYQDSDLRGMMGTIQPDRPDRAHEIVHHAARAAVLDPRSTPIEASELPTLHYVVYLLETHEPLQDAAQIDPARDGVLIEWQGKQGAIMPHTPGVQSAEQQIELARARAGIPKEAYVQIYRLRVSRLE
jgi:glycerol-3-phosphate acyltransferase PlsY